MREPRPPRRIVLTGGPGAGKTAVLEIARRHLCAHVAILPESASIIFRGGFPRVPSRVGRRCVQRAIFHVQSELENVALTMPDLEVLLCDRGTIDGLAYWPGDPEDFWSDLGTTEAEQFARYAAVVHLRTPTEHDGYHTDPIRIESAREAEEIDQRLLEVWGRHPHRFVVDSTQDFLDKAQRALAIVRAELPPDCLNEPPAGRTAHALSLTV